MPLMALGYQTANTEDKYKSNINEIQKDSSGIKGYINSQYVCNELSEIFNTETKKNFTRLKRRNSRDIKNWYKKDRRMLKNEVFNLFKDWKKPKFEDISLRQMYCERRKQYQKQINISKRSYEHEKLNAALNDCRDRDIRHIYKLLK